MSYYYCKDDDKIYSLSNSSWYSFCGGSVLGLCEVDTTKTRIAPDRTSKNYNTVSSLCDSHIHMLLQQRGYIAVYPGTHRLLIESMSTAILEQYHIIQYTIKGDNIYIWMPTEQRKAYGKHNMTGAKLFPPIVEDHILASLRTATTKIVLRTPKYAREAIKGIVYNDDGTVVIPPDNEQYRYIGRGHGTMGYIAAHVHTSAPDDNSDEKDMITTACYIACNSVNIANSNSSVYDQGKPLVFAANGVDKLLDFFDNVLSGLAAHLRSDADVVNETMWMSDNLVDALRGEAVTVLDTGGVMNLFLHYNQKGKYSRVLKDGTRVHFRIIPMLCGNPVHAGRSTCIAVVSLNPIHEEVIA